MGEHPGKCTRDGVCSSTITGSTKTSVPDFSAVVTLGPEELARESFVTLDRVEVARRCRCRRCLTAGPAGSSTAADVHPRRRRLALLYDSSSLRRRRSLSRQGLDSGFSIERAL